MIEVRCSVKFVNESKIEMQMSNVRGKVASKIKQMYKEL